MAEEFDPRLNIDYAKQRNILLINFIFSIIPIRFTAKYFIK